MTIDAVLSVLVIIVGLLGGLRIYFEHRIVRDLQPSTTGPQFNYWDQKKGRRKDSEELAKIHEHLFPKSHARDRVRLFGRLHLACLVGALLLLIGHYGVTLAAHARHTTSISANSR
jgi:hypothetical protein